MSYLNIADKVNQIKRVYPDFSIWELFDQFHICYQFMDLSMFEGEVKGYTFYAKGTFIVVIDKNLKESVKKVIGWHEFGHVINDADALISGKIFWDHSFHYRQMQSMERNANIFAAEAAIDDEIFLEMIREGYTDRAIAAKLMVPHGFVLYKAAILREKGFPIQLAEDPNSTFLQNNI